MTLLKPLVFCIVVALVGLLPLNIASAVPVSIPNINVVSVSVPNIDAGAENLALDSEGATTALTIGLGNYVVGPVGPPTGWVRPIVQFPTSDFASLSGLTLISATLEYNIVSDFLERGDTGSSEVRLFTTNETELTFDNRDVFAGLSGDGGAHTAIGVAAWSDGVTGPQSVTFSPAALTALSDAINGPDATIAISFREFVTASGFGSDLLDEIVLGVPPGNLSIEVEAEPVPEPSTGVALLLGAAFLLRRRRGSLFYEF